MMVSRDAVQGFIDGYKSTDGDMSVISDALMSWLLNHPRYKCTADDANKIIGDLGSYTL